MGHKYTKKLQFNTSTKKRIIERDRERCIFCEMGYRMEHSTGMSADIMDIMHFIPKSQMGLGVEQNGAVGCRGHHNIMDNGNKGLRMEMLGLFEAYLKKIYPDWDKKKLIYKKYNF